jgi:uncharacterized protein YjiS (DUF1127 family)
MDLLNPTYNKLEKLAVDADHLLTAVLRRWQSWSTYHKLMALDDRQLQDIGLTRPEIERTACHSSDPGANDNTRKHRALPA